jgi:hypothetical protein
MSIEQEQGMHSEASFSVEDLIQFYFPSKKLFLDFYMSWNDTTSTHCDRRLTRAAREVLRKHLLRTVFRDLERVKRDEKPFRYENWDETVHTLLEQWFATIPNLASHNTTKAKCLLYPEKQDLYRLDDAQTQHVYIQSLPGGIAKNLKIAYPQIVLKYWRKSDETQHESLKWYQCGYCGKTFVSQFYLDMHLTTHHFHNDRAQGMVCPAMEWCKLVGMANCHHQALQDEPFYDRGSGSGTDASSTLIQHKWSKIAHSVPCSVQQLQKNCESILASCGLLDPFKYNASTSQHRELTAVLFCEALTCPRQQNLWKYFEEEAHDYLLGLTSTTSIPLEASSREKWESIWKAETEHHNSLLMGITVFGVLLLWILRKEFLEARNWSHAPTSVPIPSGQRLLHKRGSQYRADASRNSSAKRRTGIKRD